VALGLGIQLSGRRNSVDPAAAFDLFGHDIQPELLLERAGDRAAYRMGLPTDGVDDLLDRRTLRCLEHFDEESLLAPFALNLLRCGTVAWRTGVRDLFLGDAKG